MRLIPILAAALAFASPAAAAPADDFHALLDEHYRWLLRENPTEAMAREGAVLRHDIAVPGTSPKLRKLWATSPTWTSDPRESPSGPPPGSTEL